MDTEKLKVIAEGMGYEIHSIHDDIVFTIHAGFRVNGFPYQPDTTNNDQMVEIMERLKISASFRLVEKDWLTSTWGDSAQVGIIRATGKTINEAVCNAAYEYFKVKL